MSRRILVIDADAGFQRLLRDQLGPYGFELVVAGDAAEAMGKLPQLQPTLLVIAVEEPDKQGFAVFNKAKKGLAANIPIVLTTATIAADSFTNHRRLKLHADEYIDKRSLSADELLGKIDNLVGLGEMTRDPTTTAAGSDAMMFPVEFPMEVDEVPMELSDGDLVLEETFGEDEPVLHQTTPPPEPALDDGVGDFLSENGPVTLMGEPMDEVLSAETDAAFDALLGPGLGDAPALGPAPTPVEPVRERSAPAIVPATTGVAVGPRPRSLSAVPEHVPAPTPLGLPILIEPESSRGPEPVEELMPVAGIPQKIGDTKPPPLSVATAHARPQFLDPATMVQTHPPTGVPRQGSVLDLGLDEIATRADEEQTSGVHDRRTLQKIHTLERENAQLKAELDRARDGKVGAGGAGRDFLNLRETISARDKEILELRENAAEQDRLLTEARERMRQFQHAKTVIEAKNVQLEQRLMGDGDRAETAEAALRAAEARAAEAQARVADVEHAARVEIERMAAAVARADKARSEAEAAMLSERGGRDSAIENERGRALAALRAELEDGHAAVLAERDQELDTQLATLRQAHGDELAELKDGHTQQLTQATDRHARELIQAREAHARELAAVQDAHGREIADAQQSFAAARDAHGEELTETQEMLLATQQALEAAQLALSGNQEDHAEALAAAGDRHARELAAAKQNHGNELAAAEQVRVQEVAAAGDAHARELAALRDEHARVLVGAQARAQQEVAAARDELERKLVGEKAAFQRQLAATRDEFGTALAAAEQARSDDLTAAMESHRTEQESLAGDHARALEAARAESARAVAEVETRLGAELEAARRATSDADDQLRAERRTLAETRRELETRHAAAVGELTAQREAELAEAARAHVAELDQRRAAHADDLEQHRGAHARELTEHQARHTATIEDLRGQHVQAIADKDAAIAQAVEDHRRAMAQATGFNAEQMTKLRAEHARALDQAEIRMRTQREADRADAARAMAASRSDHEAQLAEAHDEVAQLENGLSGMREQAKKLEEQVAGLVQTVRSRDDEIRGHVAAIEERDRRITELRGEIESLEGENASYQEQVLKAYQKIKADEATVARAKKALAIALTALHEDEKPKT